MNMGRVPHGTRGLKPDYTGIDKAEYAVASPTGRVD